MCFLVGWDTILEEEEEEKEEESVGKRGDRLLPLAPSSTTRTTTKYKCVAVRGEQSGGGAVRAPVYYEWKPPLVLESAVCSTHDLEFELPGNTNTNGTEANAAGRSARACVARELKRERERRYRLARDAPDEWAGRGRVREWKALVWGWRDL